MAKPFHTLLPVEHKPPAHCYTFCSTRATYKYHQIIMISHSQAGTFVIILHNQTFNLQGQALRSKVKVWETNISDVNTSAFPHVITSQQTFALTNVDAQSPHLQIQSTSHGVKWENFQISSSSEFCFFIGTLPMMSMTEAWPWLCLNASLSQKSL